MHDSNTEHKTPFCRLREEIFSVSFTWCPFKQTLSFPILLLLCQASVCPGSDEIWQLKPWKGPSGQATGGIIRYRHADPKKKSTHFSRLSKVRKSTLTGPRNSKWIWTTLQFKEQIRPICNISISCQRQPEGESHDHEAPFRTGGCFLSTCHVVDQQQCLC